jgi:hypothetical protein
LSFAARGVVVSSSVDCDELVAVAVGVVVVIILLASACLSPPDAGWRAGALSTPWGAPAAADAMRIHGSGRCQATR